MKQLLSAVAALVITGTVQAAGFDCAKASSAAEHMVCDDPALATLDSELGALFKLQLRTAKKTEELQAEQRRWLREVRDACRDVACLKVAYERRAYGLRFGSEWMTEQRAKAICGVIQDAANDGSLAKGFIALKTVATDESGNRATYRLDRSRYGVYQGGYYVQESLRLEHRGRTRTLGLVQGGGTCSECDIVDLDSALEDTFPVDDEQEHLRGAYFGSCDNLMIVDDELILVRTNDRSLEAGLVSWIGPDGATRPLCVLDVAQDTASIVTVKARNKGMCNAVASNRVESLPWGPYEPATPQEVLRFEQVDDKRVANVDLNMDGRPDRVQLFEYHATAGCGGYGQWLAVDATDADPSATAALESALRELDGPLNGPRSDSAESFGAMRLFRHEGKPYVLAQGAYPTNAVYSVWNNTRETWCEYQFNPKHSIGVFYLPETWPVPKRMPDGGQD